jgi:hypothetical protein
VRAAIMNLHRTQSALYIVFVLLGGCGRSASTPGAAAPLAGTPDVIVTLDGGRHACLVALRSELQGSTIPCGDLVPFLRDELRLASGSFCDIRSTGDVDRAEMTRVEASLDGAGYRLYSKTRR